MHYYRYRPYSEVSLKELLYNEMYFASPEECNDPFDSKTFFVFESDKERWRKLIEFSLLHTNASIPNELLNLLSDHICKQCPLTFDEASNKNLFTDFSSSSPNEIRIINFIATRIQDILRLYKPPTRYFVSFSKDNAEQLMWSHYSDKHKGFCLIFKAINGALNQSPTQKKHSVYRKTPYGLAPDMSYGFPESFEFTKIDYEHEVKPLNAFFHLSVYVSGNAKDKEDEQRILKERDSHYIQKSKHWEYESEYRLILQPPPNWLLGGHFDYTNQERLFHFQSSQLVGIIYGARMEKTEKDRIKELLKERNDWDSSSLHDKRIRFNFMEFDAKLSANQRKVEIIPTGLMTYKTLPSSDPDYNRLYQEWRDGWGHESEGTRSKKVKVE